MATRAEKIAKAKETRRTSIAVWQCGGAQGYETNPRWGGDDGRWVQDKELLWMRVALLGGGLDEATQAKYEKIIDAEQAEWNRLDAVYENVKATAEDD
tara:strand:- start:251 stop:544 length:294 start_codon:yes stop_codon:yes gene_type:complete